jgi:hypothetical protein
MKGSPIMKKIIMSLICLLFLFQTSALAKVEKHLSHNVIHFQSESRFKINETNNSLWLVLNREEYLGKDKLRINPEFYIGFYRDETPKSTNTDVKADLAFWTKTPPDFVLSNTKSGMKQIFTISDVGIDHARFSINNKEQLVKADKVSIVLALKDGSTQKVDIPDDVLKDWKYILTCDLLDEYKKGI